MHQPFLRRCLVASACATALLAGAQTPPTAMPAEQNQASQELRAARAKISETYKADRAACDAMKDNAKDVCIEEAKGKERVAKAELDQQARPSEANARRVAEAKADAAYAVEKEKCDDLKGNDKAACVTKAKMNQAQALGKKS